MKTWFPTIFAALLASSTLAVAVQASAATERLIIENGSSAASNEAARQSKEQWNETRTLRQKENARAVDRFDKADRTEARRESCQGSSNLNAYWEPSTQRCLDRRTGRELMAP